MQAPPPTLATPRLILRPLTLDDAPAVQLLFPHWEIVRHLNASVPWPYPPDGALAYFRDVALPAMARGDEWHWTLRLRHAPDQAIGAILLCRDDWANRGFWLGLPWHGHGLMTEAVLAVNNFWFDTLRFPRLRAPKAIVNQASRRISQKTGMRLIKTEPRDFCGGRLPAEYWEITAEEWRTWRTLFPNPSPQA